MNIQTFESKLYKKFLLGRASCILCTPKEQITSTKPRFYIRITDFTIWVPSQTFVSDDDLFFEVLAKDMLYDEKRKAHLINIDHMRCSEYTPWLYALYCATHKVLLSIYSKTIKMNAVEKNSFLKQQCMGCLCAREQNKYNVEKRDIKKIDSEINSETKTKIEPKKEMTIEELIKKMSELIESAKNDTH